MTKNDLQKNKRDKNRICEIFLVHKAIGNNRNIQQQLETLRSVFADDNEKNS